jgi:hypothetical protein
MDIRPSASRMESLRMDLLIRCRHDNVCLARRNCSKFDYREPIQGDDAMSS